MTWRIVGITVVTVVLLATVVIQAEDAGLTVIVFPGPQNLPLFAAQDNGFFTRRSLDVEIVFAPNSDELRNGLAEGRYQIAHTAIDNAFALKDKANVDIAVVLGGDNSVNHLFVQPEIKSLHQIKGKTVVYAPNTAYAYQLYEMLRQKGLHKGDYKIKPVGGTTQRLEAMTKDRDMVAGMLNPPFSIRARKAGLEDMGPAAQALGAYQGTSAFVLRSWGDANGDTLVNSLQAYIEGLRWVLDPKNKTEAIAMLAEQLNLPQDVAAQSYAVAVNPKDGFDRDGALNMEGVKNVLRLRARFEGGTPAEPEQYLDLSYHRKALAGR